MQIADVRAYPTSFPLPPDASVTLGIGRAVKRDAVAVKVTTDDGLSGAIGLSGIDMALWDIRGKATGWPLYRVLGGASRPIPAYAGGVSLCYQERSLPRPMTTGATPSPRRSGRSRSPRARTT